ncbi:MAG: 4Fe-4S dicluster domain-containing protein [Coriobacteriia bacterium]|nr:4Fe-4S dicluster domain-containing protein [Coriobacteriia bacterium]
MTAATDTFAIYYFSATGNSFLVASSLAERLGAPDPISIPGSLILADPYEAARKATKIGIVFPVHRATIPEMVRGFIAHMPVEHDRYYFAVATHTLFGCNEFWDIDEVLSSKGVALNCAHSVRMKGSVGIIQPSDASVLRGIARIQPQLDEIAEEVANGQERYFRPSIKSLNKLVKLYTLSHRKRIVFHIDEHCKSCGICVQVCPARNIELSGYDDIEAAGTIVHAEHKAEKANESDAKKRAPIRSDKCQACYACLHWCPANAISTSRRFHNRYHNPQVNPDQLNQVPTTSSEP